jgi:hypothetical protein
MSTNPKKTRKAKSESFDKHSHRTFDAIDTDSSKKKPTSSLNSCADIHYAIIGGMAQILHPVMSSFYLHPRLKKRPLETHPTPRDSLSP